MPLQRREASSPIEPAPDDLRRIYEDPKHPGSLGGIRALQRVTKAKNVQEFLEGENAYTLHAPAVEKGVLNEPIITAGPCDLWEADLLQIRGVKGFFLVVIDAYTKKAWLRHVASKQPKDMAPALLEILQDGLPENIRLNALRTDAGTEFFNQHMKRRVYQPHAINHYRAQKDPGAGIVERLNRTLGDRLERYRTIYPNASEAQLKQCMQDLVSSYNDKWHSTIQKTPNEMHDAPHTHPTMAKVNEVHDRLLEPGTLVRLHKRPRAFAKGRDKRWTDEVFTVDQRGVHNPNTYSLISSEDGEPIIGKVYRKQLQRLSRRPDTYHADILQRRGNRVLVRWVGHPHLPPEWISKQQLRT